MDKCDLRHLEYYTDMKKKKEQEKRRLKRDLKPCNVFEGIKEPQKQKRAKGKSKSSKVLNGYP